MLKEYLLNKDNWIRLITHIEHRNSFITNKIVKYKKIINENKFTQLITNLTNYNYTFSLPKQVTINKFYSEKKKTVFIFPTNDEFVLKLINQYLTERFSHLIAPNCHSFQLSKGAKTAFKNILKDKNLDKKSCLKLDIKNFFNSINIDDFLTKLPHEIKSDSLVYSILKQILKSEYVLLNGELSINNQKGIMAGSPLAPFLSNIYLSELDYYFYNQGITYARYSDDIIIFDSPEAIEDHYKYIANYFSKIGLKINMDKTKIFTPGEKWTFLGFSYKKGEIDISEASQKKLKAKIRRLSRKLYRYKQKYNIDNQKVINVFNNRLNNKFYGINRNVNDLCWARWYFPLITTSKSLKIIDKYIQERIRYSVCGSYSKKNYKVIPYSMLKNLGYKPLTHFYYLFKNNYEKFNKTLSF